MNSLLAAVALLGAQSAPAVAQTNADDVVMCQYYGVVGQVVVEELLPMTFQQVLEAIQGRDPGFEGKIGKAMIAKMPPELVGKLGKVIKNVDRSYFARTGEAAGQNAFVILFNGAAKTPEDVKNTLNNDCQTRGLGAIMAKAAEARDAMGYKSPN